MGPFGGRASSIATTVQTCCQLNQDWKHRSTDNPMSALSPPPYKVSLAASRKRFICRNGTESGGTDITTVKDDEQPSKASPEPPAASNSSPFGSGKISSRVSSTQQKENVQQKTSRVKVPPLSSSSGASKASSAAAFSSKSAKAFPAPPTVSSPFDEGPVAKKAPVVSKSRRSRNLPDIDERILASRKEILDALWKERRQEKGVNPAPADIFDDPKPLPTDAENYKVELIRGTKPIVLIISFALIVAVMFGTAFIAWKLGAFHYDEL